MKAWLGHYLHDHKSWFVVFAATKDEAVNFVDCEVAEPDYDSVQPLRHSGMIGFSVKPDPDGGEPGDLSFLIDEANGDHIVFHGDQERIEKETANPRKSGKAQEVSGVAAHLGVSDPRVFATYLPRCVECGKKHAGPCSSATA